MNNNHPTRTVDSYPLSPMQQGMLFHALADPTSGTDLEQIVCTLNEPLNPGLFHTAWKDVANRHAVFRTQFRWEKLAEPVQEVLENVTLPFVELNWEGQSATEQASQLARFLAADRDAGFDLSAAPAMRITLVKLAAHSYQCIWTFHHILLDGRSFPTVLSEVFILYSSLERGTQAALPVIKPFRSYIDWLAKQDWSKAESYWRDRLKGFTVPTTLRTIRASVSATERTPTKGTQALTIPSDITSKLKAFAKTNGVTLNTLVQGAWAILLSRYSGEEDVVFGVIRACRRSTIPDADSTVGIFINTVPLRVNVSPVKPVAEWLHELRNQEFDLRKVEHTPLMKIQQWSEVRGRKTLFDSLLMFDHAQLDTAMRECGIGNENRRFDLKERISIPLVLQAYGEESMLLKLEYARTSIDDGTAARMIGQVEVLLEGLVSDANQLLGSIPILTAPERNQLIFEWNEAGGTYASDRCIHELVEIQAERTPDAVALTCDGISLSYRELNRQANRLARMLGRFRVGPDILVGICLERSNDLVIGLLAILKAGGAYLPIDLAYPADRLAFMLSDSKAPVLITQSKLLKDLPPTPAEILCIDEIVAEPTTSAEDENPKSPVGPDHLAYVIYTSGTTGKPKGSQITHRNVTRLFSATDHWYHFNERDVWTLFHSYAFDFSVWEIWGALLYGGRVVVVPYMVSRSPEAFYELLAKEQVTVLNQTPSAFRQLVQAESVVGQKKLALRYVIFGGEALEMQSLRPWFERHGDQQPLLVNMYGITETTVHVTYRPLARGDVKADSVIGIPIPDLQVYILDPQRQPVPIGVPGEMYVGGAGLARGYLNRPDLTADRFIPDHLTGRPGSRLYKTGDLARFLPGRDIEYMGRIDHQVKIRGFRIELGEIESVLCQHPAIREAVVLAREDTPGDKRLVAYFVANGSPPAVKELRDHLKKKVPEYMVPAHFIPLPSIPLTTNGKVDRKALPAPDQERPNMGNAMVAPRTESEREVAKIWSEVLGVEHIGVDDNFFELGGHSLMVLRAISLINDRFGADIPPVAMFEHPTISGLCALLQTPPTVAQPATTRQEKPTGTKSDTVDLSRIASIAMKKGATRDSNRPYRMRESWICKWILAPLYGIGGGTVRSVIQRLILKLENGDYFTVTLRKLYVRHYELEIGEYSTGFFDVNRLQTKTKVGRYSGAYPSVIARNAEHPRNTISTNALFYHSAFKFAQHYELARVQLRIGNDVFIGHNATILYPTKSIGDGAVIAAGSVVTDDVPPYAIVGGYPAKVLRYRFSKETIAELLNSKWWEASLEELEPVKGEFARPLEGDKIS